MVVRCGGSHIFYTNGSGMAVRLSGLSADRALLTRKIPGTHFCWRLTKPQGHSAAGSKTSTGKKNPNTSLYIKPATFRVVK
jgi:hypothetical protein